MAKKEFKAESKRLLDIMINSIYSQKEVFLRELISNSSDANDKIYYRALRDDSMTFDKDNYYIEVIPNKEERTLTIKDTGIGMTEEELETNLGVIAKSGSLAYKKENEIEDGHDIIVQFGVGFYAAFMVADKVTVLSRALESEEGYKWESSVADGYIIEPYDKSDVGTEIILNLKENREDEDYDQYLDETRLQKIIKKYLEKNKNMDPILKKNKEEMTNEE